MGNENVNRCEWAKSELAIDYHDNEWAVPQHEDLILFEHLFLDTMQAGLSWELMLKKRENFRMAFDNFDPYIISNYGDPKIEKLLTDPGIVRNRLKIKSTVTNAKGFLTIQRELGSFDRYLWSFVGGKPIVNEWRRLDQIPSRSMEAEILSKDLKSRGFKFVGPTICYAFMQAVGVVNDHTVDCFRYTDIAQMT
jgi:DNA-3-methyladenine glycosylase I